MATKTVKVHDPNGSTIRTLTSDEMTHVVGGVPNRTNIDRDLGNRDTGIWDFPKV